MYKPILFSVRDYFFHSFNTKIKYRLSINVYSYGSDSKYLLDIKQLKQAFSISDECFKMNYKYFAFDQDCTFIIFESEEQGQEFIESVMPFFIAFNLIDHD